MGKRRGGKKQHKKLQHEREAPVNDGNDSDEMFDEVDRFNNDRDATSTDLTRKSKRPTLEAVLNVEGDDFSDDQEEVNGDFEDSDDDDEAEVDEDGDLPNANQWGNKRAGFYGSSYVDEDWGGVNASDEEAIDLEEEDALARQKKLDAVLASIDYGDAEKAEGDVEMKEAEEEKEEEADSPEKMMELLKARRPEYDHMVEEYKEKKALMKSTIVPLKKFIEMMGEEDFPLRKEIEAVTYLFSSYFSSLLFYVHYVHSLELEDLGEVSKHPVIEQLMKLKKYLNDAETLIDFNERQFRKLCTAIDDGKKKSAVKVLARIAGKLPAKPEKISISDDKENELVEAEEAQVEVADDDEKRKITYEIEKNKGLTAKRKKTKKHSRIQKRVQFRKAVVKRRSQVPDVRREMDKYAGESRGIRAATVKSTKLKA